VIGNLCDVFCACLKVCLAIFRMELCWNDTDKRNISMKRSTYCLYTTILHFTENSVCFDYENLPVTTSKGKSLFFFRTIQNK